MSPESKVFNNLTNESTGVKPDDIASKWKVIWFSDTPFISGSINYSSRSQQPYRFPDKSSTDDSNRVLWDCERGVLILVRSRIPSSEIYYHIDSNTKIITISNNLASITNTINRPLTFNQTSILRQLYALCPAEGESSIQGIQSIPSGSYLEISVERIQIKCYWENSIGEMLLLKNDNEYADKTLTVLNSIIGEYSSDENAGIMLSGGMDSTTTLACLKQSTDKIIALSWFTKRFTDEDESKSIALTAKHFNIPVSWISIDDIFLNQQILSNSLQLNHPFNNFHFPIIERILQRAATLGLKKIYTGLGGDELFGCRNYAYTDLFLSFKWLQLIRQINRHAKIQDKKQLDLIKARIIHPLLIYSKIRDSSFDKLDWVNEEFFEDNKSFLDVDNILPQDILNSRKRRLSLFKYRYAKLHVAWANQCAAKYDITVVHPLLDYRLAEYVMSLPGELFFKNGYDKYILRKAMAEKLPESITSRKTKVLITSLGNTLAKIIIKSNKPDFNKPLMSSSLGYIDQIKLENQVEQYLSGYNQDASLWSAVCLENWLGQITQSRS